ncbi:Polyketide cyclase / dehydrase and lipid transport [Arthrobacter subterraneus]|uniref:Polyketide cyclase / dehydrase and lipid transport n=1 Tax=Arthrobacter subterraneus TaxID=335973 RepID=A0A1G8HAV7_9MICC|nr:SRPBCC family protein [Arthrobacter subterraneus]SDI03719.1 Polyketide cyclase / dehydrase and lipid transport [Arthrobacter subterraneus]
MTTSYLIRRERFIPAPASAIFEVLATPALHSVIDGSGTVTGEQPNGPQRLSKGARFGMDMKIGAPYKILNTVVEFEEGRRIAWRHFSRHVWRYTLQEHDGGTLVAEEWDARSVPGRPLLKLLGFTRKHPESIERTLENLDRYVMGQRLP